MEKGKSRAIRTADQFAALAAAVARAACVDVVICVTETGRLFRSIRQAAKPLRVVAATPSPETDRALCEEGCEVVRLPVRVPNRFKEARHAIAVALQAGKLRAGDLVQCVIGQGLFGAHGDFMVLMDVGAEAGNVPLHDLVKISVGVQPNVLDAALELACRIGSAARRGKRVGTVFVIGDSRNVLRGSRQLVLNPLEGHKEEHRTLGNPAVHDMIIELAKLDGAFVVRGDGFIRSAGTYLAPGPTDVQMPKGLGARHVTAAAITARTRSIAIVVSATEGTVRVFSHGSTVMQIDPDLAVGVTSHAVTHGKSRPKQNWHRRHED